MVKEARVFSVEPPEKIIKARLKALNSIAGLHSLDTLEPENWLHLLLAFICSLLNYMEENLASVQA